MRTAIFVMSCAVTLASHLTRGYSIADNPLDKLIKQLDGVEELVAEVEKMYQEDKYHHPVPKKYLTSFSKTRATFFKVSALIDEITFNDCQSEKLERLNGKPVSNHSTRRSNSDLIDNENLYKALSRVLKHYFKDDPLIRENIDDSIIPPTRLDKPKQ